jgi:hypothetical protein
MDGVEVAPKAGGGLLLASHEVHEAGGGGHADVLGVQGRAVHMSVCEFFKCDEKEREREREREREL